MRSPCGRVGVLVRLLRKPRPAPRCGAGATAAFVPALRGRATRPSTRRTGGSVARRGRSGAIGARTDLVVEAQCERDALARLVDLEDLDADDVAGLGDVA